MTAIRGKIVIDGQKFIIQIDGDSSSTQDFDETEMYTIALGNGSINHEAVFKDKNGEILSLTFSEKIEISRNMLDKDIIINIENMGDMILKKTDIDQFIQLISNKHGISSTNRDWRRI